MLNSNEKDFERDKKDLTRFASEIAKSQHNELLSQFVKVALSSYINGVQDVYAAIKNVQPSK